MGQADELISMLKMIDRLDRDTATELLALAGMQQMIDPSFSSDLRKLLSDPGISSGAKMLVRSALQV